MTFYTPKEIAELWQITPQMVRRYCKEGRIKSAIQFEGNWLIPEGTPKPGTDIDEDELLPPLAKKMLYQHARNNHYGIYEYMQISLAYSSNRMASNRLTQKQVEDIYRTNKLCRAFEATKVDDIIEVVNHFICMRYVMDNLNAPLTTSFIKQLHQLLSYGTFSDRKHKTSVGEFRTKNSKLGIPADNIQKELFQAAMAYERKPATLDDILEFHVALETIHPFDDYNGRVGRIIMMKECLRYGVDPFIIDDKHRSAYFKGIALWKENPELLRAEVHRAQQYFKNKVDTCRLMQYHRPPVY